MEVLQEPRYSSRGIAGLRYGSKGTRMLKRDLSVSGRVLRRLAGAVLLSGSALLPCTAAESDAPPLTRTGPAGIRLRRIEPGRFRMGSERGDRDELPRRIVEITRPFYLGVHEVTQAQWQATMGTRPWIGKTRQGVGGGCPASFVSWKDATAFCAALARKTLHEVHLPTEAQWEFACRAGGTGAYCFGDNKLRLGLYAWYTGRADGEDKKCGQRVGALQANAWGLYDMHGNVWEWCADWFAADYYVNSPVDDPSGASTGSARVHRGGLCSIGARFCRSACRDYRPPGFRLSNLGFRLASVLVDK